LALFSAQMTSSSGTCTSRQRCAPSLSSQSGNAGPRSTRIGVETTGSLIEISLSVSPMRDELGTIIGASKIARDITQRKQIERQAAILAREAEHRTRNILATVSAAVELSESDTPEGLKASIRGRIQALANAHTLFVESRWSGAELNQLVAQELSPYRTDPEGALIEGPRIVLEPTVAQAVAVTVHELATNAAKYGALSGVRFKVMRSRLSV
jgi:light-regulated signal transduction histidine kinase (bacteriophytochrome)